MRTAPLACVAAALALLACSAPGSTDEPSPTALVLITVDTLRADRLGAYGSERGLTPNLDALAAESLVFDAAYAPTPFTVPSLVSLHTGLHPLSLGLQINSSEVAPEALTLAEALAERGWKTAAVVSNAVLRGREDVAQGFEIYDDTMLQEEAIRRWPERIAADTTDAAIRLLDTWRGDARVADAPLFLWVHYQDPHGPYTPPPGWRERFLAAERSRDPRRLPTGAGSHGEGGIPRYQQIDEHDEAAFYRAGYDGEIAYLDGELGRLLDALREKGLGERLVFAADHGESMGEDDYWFAHGNDLTDPLLRVPLFVRWPGLAPGRRGDVARLADLHPTLLGALLDAPPTSPDATRDLLAPEAAQGASVPLLTTLAVYPHRRLGIVADGYKLILTLRSGVWTSRLHRRGDESIDLAAPAPHVASALRERVWALRDERTAAAAAPLRPVDEQERRQLEALGYTAEPAE
ncbi:MAG: sulfatase [Myxococcota bacterium]